MEKVEQIEKKGRGVELTRRAKNFSQFSTKLPIVFFAAAICVSLFIVLFTLRSARNSENTADAAIEEASAENYPAEMQDDFGTGGASYPAGDAVLENIAAENAALIPEEYGASQPVSYFDYKIQKGDVIGKIAIQFGLNDDTLISVNGIKNTRAIHEGEILKVPNQDGILYSVNKNDTIESITEKYKIERSALLTVNEYFSSSVKEGENLFIPGARMERAALQEINGDLFLWPTTNRYVTSVYGWRRSPISGARLFHTGIDIRGNTGAPVYAAMAGRITYTGYNETYGNHIVISHHSGYRTLYGHLSVIRVKTGVYVSTGQRIGDVGNTGVSTGPHLHFTVYKDGVTVNPRILTN